MQDNSNVAHFFSEIQETMKQKFRGWENDLPHQGEKGGIRERRVAEFLSAILPKKYGIGTGHIIDSQEKPVISYQTDIVIYDAQNGIVLPVDNYYSLFPCECVYATIEVKSRLTASEGENGPSGTISECLKGTTRLKNLDRAKHDLLPIHSIVFAYETAWEKQQASSVKKWFETLGKSHFWKLPEIVLVLDPGFALVTVSPTGYNMKGKLTCLYEKDPLLFFVSDLIHRLSQTNVYTPNLWDEYRNVVAGDTIMKMYKE
jgi:hypothetical protein